MSFKIKAGHDGKVYAVFKDSWAAEKARWLFPQNRIACFDGYDNAYQLVW